MKNCSLNAIIEKTRRTITHIMVFCNELATEIFRKK